MFFSKDGCLLHGRAGALGHTRSAALLTFLLLSAGPLLVPPTAAQAPERPNVIIIFTDDQGYGDVGAFGAEGYETPNLDRMAAEGNRFTDFYVAAPVCTPSRAALLTGSYPKRVGLAYRVLFPFSPTGLNPEEVTIAEMLKARGYATAAVGKWHLGHHTSFLPTRQGFDTYFGIPYSNDMGNNAYGRSEWARAQGADSAFVSPLTPLMRGEEVVESGPDQTQLTRRYTEEALRFIEENRAAPFFLYLAHSMPHVPIAASEAFAGRSAHGLYGDVISEIDWSVGQILAKLDALGLDENTVVFFTTDNGPQVWEGEESGWVWSPENDGRGTRGEVGYRSGSAGPLRGSKNTTWEGGMRVPMIARWPGRIPAGTVTSEMGTAMDLLPTIARITGGTLPPNVQIDGYDIGALLRAEPGAQTPYAAFYYYRDDRLQAVRSGRWKLHVYRPEWEDEDYEGSREPLLFDLYADVGETHDRASEYPQVVAQLEALAEAARADLGDAATGREGTNVRPVGHLRAQESR